MTELAHPAHPAQPGYPGYPGNQVHRITDTAILALSGLSIDDFVSIKWRGVKSRIVLCMVLPSGCSSGHPAPFEVAPDASVA